MRKPKYVKLTKASIADMFDKCNLTQHDERFITMMNDLNRKYNLGITVRAKQMRKEFIG